MICNCIIPQKFILCIISEAGDFKKPPACLCYIDILTFKLAVIQFMVKSTFFQQFFMIALLDDLTVFHN